MNRRQRFLRWVMTRAGIEEGQILPRWGVALNLMLFPSRILWVIGCHVYDAMSDSIIIGKVRLSLYQLERTYSNPSPAGQWFRVAGHHSRGFPIIETRADSIDLLRLRDDCRADKVLVEIGDGMVHITAFRWSTGLRLTRVIPENALRSCAVPHEELVRRLMGDFTESAKVVK